MASLECSLDLHFERCILILGALSEQLSLEFSALAFIPKEILSLLGVKEVMIPIWLFNFEV